MEQLLGSQWLAKICIILTLLFTAATILKPVRSARHKALRRLGLWIFAAAAVISTLFPEILAFIAHFLGIGRGADLLLYALILLFFNSIATAHRRESNYEKKLTLLARSIALMRAEIDELKKEKSDSK